MKKSVLSIFLIFCYIIGTVSPLPVMAKKQEDAYSAYAILGDDLTSLNFKDVKSGTNETPDKGEKDGEKCWIMSNRLGNDKLAYINFDLEDEFAHNLSSGDVYEIEVDYYDQEKGYFYLEYDSQFKPMKQAEVTYLQNEDIWKTAKYTIDDAYFGGRVDDGYDFRLVIKPWKSTVAISPGPVAIKEVRVKKIPGKNPIWATASTDVAGNSFTWFEKEKVIHNTLKNLTENTMRADVTFSAIGTTGHKVFEYTETMEFGPLEEKKKDLCIETDRCDLYDWVVTVKAEQPKIDSKMQRIKFAIIKTDPDGIRNEHAYLSNHLERYYTDYPNAIEEGVDLISKSNVMGIRGSGYWTNMEPKIGEYVLDGIPETLVSNAAREKGMEVMWQLNAGHNTITGLWSNLIRTEEEFKIYGNFLKYFVNQVKDYTTDYEIANELDLANFNSRGLSVEELTKMIDFAAGIIKENDSDAKVHAWGFTWIKGDKDWSMFTEAVERGTLNNLDFISYHPYDNTEVVELNGISHAAQKYLNYIRERNPEVGLSITEVGNSITDKEVSYDERNLGSNMTRMGVHFLSREVADVLVYYNFDRKGITPLSAREDGFGMVALPMTRATDDSGKAMTPYESYIAFTAMNYLMAQTEPSKVYDPDSNIKISSFDSKKFDGKVLAMNTVLEPSVVSLKLDCESIRQFDDFGNEKIIYGNDGVYTFCLDDRLTYVVGNFTSVEIIENAELSLEKAMVGAVMDDMFTIDAVAPEDKNYEYQVELPFNCELIEISDVENGNGKAKIHLKERYSDYTFVDVILKDKETGKINLWGQVRVTIPIPITSDMTVELISSDNIDRWRSVFSVTNNSYSNAVQGYIKFNSPKNFASMNKIDIGIIPPGKTAELKVELPPLYRKGIYSIDYDVVTNKFGAENYIATKDLTVAVKTKNDIVIDGKLGSDEWNKNSFMYADTIEQIGNITDWRGPDDISLKAAVAYDENNMYLAADVTDNKFFQDQQGKTTWQGDGIQVGIFYGEAGHTAIGDRATTFHELAIALTPNGPETYRHLSQDNVYPSGPFENAEVAIVQDGKHTYYEARIPWKDLLLEGQHPKAGDKLGFAMLANDNDGNGRRGWIHYAGGIAPSKTTQLFTYLFMTE